MNLYGLDGSGGGWAVCALHRRNVVFKLASFDAFEKELASIRGPFRVVVDAPIGLLTPESPATSGDRGCDKAARRIKLTGGVFTPPRGDQFKRFLEKKPQRAIVLKVEVGMSRQTWNILPYMQAAHRLHRRHPDKVIESHPEIVWPLIGASRNLGKKKTDKGFFERNKLITRHLGINLQSELLRTGVHPRGRGSRRLRKKGRDDWTDAAAMLIVAKVWSGKGVRLPVLYDPPDREGYFTSHQLRELKAWKQGRIIAIPRDYQPA